MAEVSKFHFDLDEQFPHLPAAPIVEAVVQWRARAEKAWEPDALRQELNQRLPDYPKCDAFGIESHLRDELATVWEECREPNWDGYDALPVTQDTLRNAYQFLESMPADVSAPSIGAEPDGDLTLDWHRSPRRTLSVSVSPDGDLHYSALFGSNRVYGTEAFFGDIPNIILDLIRRLRAA